jgi:threonine aldolase
MEVEPIETNIIIFYVGDEVNENKFVTALKSKNILISSMGEGKLRMVTHLDFTQEMLKRVIEEIKNLKL